MKKFVHLISSTNPIEIDQIKFALQNEGIEFKVIGESALAIGSVELTGIQGANVQVPEEKLVHANKVLSNIGLGQNKTEDNFQKYFIAIASALAFVAIAYLIYLGIS